MIKKERIRYLEAEVAELRHDYSELAQALKDKGILDSDWLSTKGKNDGNARDNAIKRLDI